MAENQNLNALTVEQTVEQKRLAALGRLAATKQRDMRLSMFNSATKLLVAGTLEHQKFDVPYPSDEEIHGSFAMDLEFLNKINSLVVQRRLELHSKMADLSIENCFKLLFYKVILI